MRTGAIFARGSCRALKWMALFGVVLLPLGAGSASAQVTITGPADDTVMEGGTAEYTVTVEGFIAAGAAAGAVTVTVATPTPDTTDAALAGEPEDISGNSVLTYEVAVPAAAAGATASVAFSASGTIEVRTTHDDDAEDEKFTLAFAAPSVAGLQVAADDTTAIALPTDGDDVPPTELTIDDDETQNYVLSVTTDEPMEGMPIVATLTASPAHVGGSSAVTLELSDDMGGSLTGYSLVVAPATDATTDGTPVNNNIVTIGTGASGSGSTTKATVTITTPDNDMNRDPDAIVLTASTTTGGVREVKHAESISVADANVLPMVMAALTDADGDAVTDDMVTEGMMYTLTVTVVDAEGEAAEAGEALTISLTGAGEADMDDYSLSDDEIDIASDGMSGAVTLTVAANEDLNDETLMFSAVVMGDAANDSGANASAPMDLLSLMIKDATMKQVYVMDGAEAAIEAAMMAAKGDDGMLNPDDDFSVMKSTLFGVADGYTMRVAAQPSDPAVVEVDDNGDSVMVMPKSAGTAMVTVTATAVPAASPAATQLSVSVAEITFDVMVEAAPLPPLAVPGMPGNLTATAGAGQVMLSWAAPSTGGAVASYEYDVDASGDWMSAGTGTTHTVSGLTNGTEYLFQVRAVNDAGAGEPTAGVKATPMAPDPGVQVTVKSVSAATSVPESGGLEVTVVATVPAGMKVDDKVAPIASRSVMVSFPTDDASIKAGEDADDGEVTPLGATGGSYMWTNITRTDKDSEQTYKFRVAIGQDLDAEDEKFQVEVQIDGAAKRSKVVTIDDAQEQTYVLSLPSAAKGAIKEGAAATTLTLKADPARTIDIPAALALNPNDPSKYTLGALSSDMFGINAVTASIAAKADGNRVDDTITVTAYSGALGAQAEIASLDITVTDANALPAVEATLVDKDGKALDPQPESVMEGETVKVMLTAVDKDGKAMKAAEKLTITLMPTGTADGQDYRLSSQSIEIASGKDSSAAVDLMVTEDQDVGEETLMFSAVVSGEAKVGTEKREVMGVLSLMIMDGTRKLVWAKTQEEVEAAVYAAKNAGAGADMTFTAGEMIEVMGSALFSSAEGVTLTYTAESDPDHVATTSVSGGMVTVTAGDETGMAHITITAHASMPSGVKILDQTDPGMASIMFPVEVGLEALSIMLMGPEDMNLAEGMSAEVTATANRAVTADTMVMLMRDRAMSSASDDDFMAEAITIMAGETMGSTMVMAVEDNMMEDMEELVLYGMTEGMAGEVTGEVKLYLWDAAVPALPVIAQLLLAAFLAFGGYRRYRRR